MSRQRIRTAPEESVQLESVELFEVLGRGGTATVRRGYQPLLDRYVAVKIFTPGSESFSKDAVDHELRVAAVLPPHPAIVAVYSGGVAGGATYLISELVSGGSLEHRLTVGQAMSLTEVVSMAIWLAAALETIHLHGVVHGDLSASNVLLTRSGVPKLSDFGLASRSSIVSRRGLTPGAVAPEVLAGEVPTPASDLYQLGVLIRRAGASVVSHDLDCLVDRLTASCPGDRPSSAAEVLDALHALGRGLPDGSALAAPVIPPDFDELELAAGGAARSTQPPPSPPARPRSSWPLAAVAAALLLLGVIVGRWVLPQADEDHLAGVTSSKSTSHRSATPRTGDPIGTGLASYSVLSAVADSSIGAPTGLVDQRDASVLMTSIVEALQGSNVELMPNDAEMVLPRLPYRVELQAFNALSSAPCRLLLTGQIRLTGSGDRLAMIDTVDGAVMAVVWVASLASDDDAHALLSTYAFHAGLGAEGCSATGRSVTPTQVKVVHGRDSEAALHVDESAIWRGDADGTASAVGVRRGKRVVAVLLRGSSGTTPEVTLDAIARAAADSVKSAP